MRDGSMALWLAERGRFVFRWLTASAFAVLVTGCAAPTPAGSDRAPVGANPRSSRGEVVSAGGRVRSKRYVMDFVLGQSTQNQDESISRSYLARGGFIGGNGRAR